MMMMVVVVKMIIIREILNQFQAILRKNPNPDKNLITQIKYENFFRQSLLAVSVYKTKMSLAMQSLPHTISSLCITTD